MNKRLTYSFTGLLRLFITAMLISAFCPCKAQIKFQSAEKLNRGLVALPASSSNGNFISWRLLGTDKKSTTFDLLRDGTVIAADLDKVTNYTDPAGTKTSKYQVNVKVDGEVVETSETVGPWTNIYRTLKLDRPSNIYTPNDCSVGDVDGDGEYEIFVKWDPSTSKDNSQSGKTDKVYIDCYKLSGKRLWRIDLGDNIRAGAHYTQYLVYDFDGDGKAELICKTAPGSKDGKNQYVSQAATISAIKNSTDNATVYANGSGYILSGPEYLSVFDGQTGAAIHTIYYSPNRGGTTGGAPSGSNKSFWGDDYGNRCDRYLACVAYLDGQSSRPSAVMCRGYYTKAYVWAVDFDGTTLSTKWLHASTSGNSVTLTDANGKNKSYSYNSPTSGGGSATAYSNGNHNISVADVDADGCDEIIYGSAAIDNDGMLLYATGFGHGDAMHLSDLIPDRPGLEVFQVHESKGTYSWDLHDAGTGEIIHKGGNSGKDNGRGLSADIIASNRGFEFLSSDDRSPRSATTGEYVSSAGTSVNFRIYWDGDLQDELLDDKKLDKVAGDGVSRIITLYEYGASTDCNYTKHTPCLQADIFGDWREEIIYFDGNDGCTLNIFSTNKPSPYRVPTLMHDHVYRLGVAWQNAAYNQPPHLGFYLPDLFVESEDDTDDMTNMFTMNYEDASDASSWQSADGFKNLSLQTDNTNYIMYEGNVLTNSCSCYTLFSSGDLQTYTLDFDVALTPGNRDLTELTVMTESGTYQGNEYYSTTNGNAHYLFHLINTEGKGNTYIINGDESQTITLPEGVWCQVHLKVNAARGTVDYTIKNRAWNFNLAQGSYSLPEETSPVAAGIYYLSGRFKGIAKFDNINISTNPNQAYLTYLYVQDFEKATDASSWQSPDAFKNLSLEADDTQYIKYTGNAATNNRSNYMLFDSDEHANFDLYTIEMDFALTPGNREASELAVMSKGGIMENNAYYAATNNGEHSLFDITSTGSYSTTFYVNGDKSESIKLPKDEWCTLKLDVNSAEKTVDYVITNRNEHTQIAKGTYTLPAATSTVATGIYYLSGRYSATAKFDNIYISTNSTESTGIECIEKRKSYNTASESAIYNLSGQRVTKVTSPGIYIQNGRKIYIR